MSSDWPSPPLPLSMDGIVIRTSTVQNRSTNSSAKTWAYVCSTWTATDRWDCPSSLTDSEPDGTGCPRIERAPAPVRCGRWDTVVARAAPRDCSRERQTPLVSEERLKPSDHLVPRPRIACWSSLWSSNPWFRIPSPRIAALSWVGRKGLEPLTPCASSSFGVSRDVRGRPRNRPFSLYKQNIRSVVPMTSDGRFQWRSPRRSPLTPPPELATEATSIRENRGRHAPSEADPDRIVKPVPAEESATEPSAEGKLRRCRNQLPLGRIRSNSHLPSHRKRGRRESPGGISRWLLYRQIAQACSTAAVSAIRAVGTSRALPNREDQGGASLVRSGSDWPTEFGMRQLAPMSSASVRLAS